MGINLDELDNTEFLNFEEVEFCTSFALSITGCWGDYYDICDADDLAKKLFMHYALGLACLYAEEEDNQHFEDWRETYSHHLMLKGIWAIDDENQEELNKVIHAMDSQMCNWL